eukprot:1363254-Amphidinium_carterae.1
MQTTSHLQAHAGERQARTRTTAMGLMATDKQITDVKYASVASMGSQVYGYMHPRLSSSTAQDRHVTRPLEQRRRCTSCCNQKAKCDLYGNDV